MILLVADTGPLHYLVEIEAVRLLPVLVEKVVVPMPVWRELQSPNAAASVKQWMLHPPDWLEVRETPEPAEPAPPLSPADQACLALAAACGAMLLMDDRAGRRAAAAMGLRTIGTLGLLEAASAKGLLPLPEAVRRLRQTGIYLTDDLYAAALARDRARRG